MQTSTDSWQLIFFAAAGFLVLLQAWRGWRLGIVRQVISLFALLMAYLMGIFGGRFVVPLLRPIGMPDQLAAILAGAALGMVVFCIISIGGAVLFKKTSEQRLGFIRFGYGASGALVGALFGIFLVWISVLSIRVLGSLAQHELESAKKPRTSLRSVADSGRSIQQPNSMVRGLAHMKHSLEHGAAGAVVEQVDPIPGSLYAVLAKLGQMVSDEQSVNRFLSYPGVQQLTEHPKIVALQTDPVISRDIMQKNYFALIRNQRIVAAATDAEIAELMRKFEFEKALDHALRKPEKHEHTRSRQ